MSTMGQSPARPPAHPSAAPDIRRPPRDTRRRLRRPGEPASRLPRKRRPRRLRPGRRPGPDRPPGPSRRPPSHRLRAQGRRSDQGPRREALGQPGDRDRPCGAASRRAPGGPASPRPAARLRLGLRQRAVRLRLEPGPARDHPQDRQGAAALLRRRRVGRLHPGRRRGPGARAGPCRRPEDAAPGRSPAPPSDRPLPPAHRRPVLPHRALDRATPASATGARSPATTSPRCTARTRPAGSPTPPIRRRSSPGRSAGAGTTRATRQSTATPPRTAPGSTRPRRTRRTGPPRTRAAQVYLKPSGTGTSSRTSPTGPRRRRPRCPRTGCSSWSSTTATTEPCRRPRSRDQPWPVRPDPFSTHRAGFEIRTYRRVQRFLFFNNFPAEATAGADCLVRSLDLAYSDQQAPADPRNPIYTFLASVTQTGYRQDGAGLGQPVACRRSSSSTASRRSGQQVLTLDPGSQANLPEGLDGSSFRWADLDGEGLSGHPEPTPAAAGTTSGTSAPATSSRSRTARSVARASFGPLRDRRRACRRAPT